MKITTLDDANFILGEIAKRESFIARKEADMNAAIQRLKEKFDTETENARQEKDSLVQHLEAFALMNKSLFAKTRSAKLLFGEIGFRVNPPKVLQLNRKYSVQTSIELLKKIFSGKYIRTKEEIDKENILASYAANELSDDKLAAVGLKIDQDENFIYKIDWEKLENGNESTVSKNSYSEKRS